MSERYRVTAEMDGGAVRIMMAGVDVTDQVEKMILTSEDGKLRAELTLDARSVRAALDPDARVSDVTEQLLLALGWTPPVMEAPIHMSIPCHTGGS